MQEQIISHGYTPDHVWRELEQRSSETRHRIEPLCPACNATLHHTDTTELRCPACDAPVEVYQHRHHTEKSDTRLIYIQVNGQRRAVLRLNLQCLSCELPLQRDETCRSTCDIQTYLVSEQHDGQLYIKRWANRRDVPRNTPFIPICPEPDNAIAFANETPNTENLPLKQPVNPPKNQPPASDDFIREHTNRHTDVKGQVLAYLTEHHIATTPKLRAVCNCSSEALNQALHKLIDAQQIRKVKRGVYEFINQT